MLCGGSLPLLVRPLDDDRPMIRRTFCSRVENERGVYLGLIIVFRCSLEQIEHELKM